MGVAGPLAFKNEEYNGSVPNLVLRQHSWTKVWISCYLLCWQLILVSYFESFFNLNLIYLFIFVRMGFGLLPIKYVKLWICDVCENFIRVWERCKNIN